MPALQSLPQIWELIKKHNIGKIIAFERNVIPDSWTLPGIECIDIKQSSLKPYHAVDGYSIATINDEALESWKSKYPNGIIPTTEIKFEHLDDLIRAD